MSGFSGGPADKVTQVFNQASAYATSNTNLLGSFLGRLNSAIYSPPKLTLKWESFAAPTLDVLPGIPALPSITFQTPAGQPAALTDTPPVLNFADVSEIGPAPSFSSISAPILDYGATPQIPSVRDVGLPTAPQIQLPSLPPMLSLSVVPFQQIDLREDWLDKLETIPQLEVVAPTGYSYARGAEYASGLLEQLKDSISRRMRGGTGLDPVVEQAIWDRSRDRETLTALANEREIMRQSEALGFALPSGVLAEQLRQSQINYYDKLSGLSRDIAIKQAELEQANLKDAIAQGMQLESTLIDYSYKLEQLAFEASKVAADNAVTTYNAEVTRFQALLDGYKTYASSYQTIIQGELSKVEVYKAQLSGEQTKADINKSLVESYKAQVDARMANVEIYKAQVGAAKTLVELEQTRVSAAGEQIRAYVAQVNAETSKIEAYKAQVEGQAAQAEVYRSKVGAFSAKVGAQAEQARVHLARYTALSQTKAAEWQAYGTRVTAESERIRALGMQSSSLLDSYRAAATAITAKAEMTSRMWESQIKQYDASANYSIQVQKINADNLIQSQNSRSDAAKVGAQVYAQLAASAYGMMNATAGVSGTSTDTSTRSGTVAFNYSGTAAPDVTPITDPREL